MSRLALYFLGPPRVSLDGASVEVPRRKVLALLAYLAVSAQRHSRDELAELLYGRQDRAHSRASLRQTLSLLRRVVGGAWVGTDRLQVWLSSGEGLWIDVVEFRRLIDIGRKADAQNDLAAVKNHLAAAVSLYRREFLSGFYTRDSVAFENWQMFVQEEQRQQQISALQRLMEIHGAAAEYERAIEYGRCRLGLDPLDEDAHRQLMRFHSLAGQRLEALRQYEQLRLVLQRELGEAPEEETERVREQITTRRLSTGADLDQEKRQGSFGSSIPRVPARIPLLLFAQLTVAGVEPVPDHESRLRKVLAEERGRIVSTAGRMFCAGFPTAAGAVRAALHALTGTGAAGGGLRIVLLAGERLRQEVPSSLLLERAGTLLDASQAGQVLLNEAAAELAAGLELPGGATLRCLGIHRLKDLGPPQSIYRLEHPDLPQGSARLETLDSRPNNFKIQPTPFIGRESELAALHEALCLEQVRLLTLTGVAGTGKTRLALQAAAGLYRRFAQGLFFVDLSSLRAPDQVAGAVAAALGVREAGGDGRALLETLKDYLGSKQILLLLDNFEHLLPAAPQVAELLANCPRLKILATSREALRLQAERVFVVHPMQLASPGQSIQGMKHCETVRLFAERAAAARSTFQIDEANVKLVVEICRRLDGLPLAIELAATRLRALTLPALLSGLKSRLRLLKGGSRDLPERQQALRSEIDWSHELLESGERCVFRRLSVFPAGCTPEATVAVCQPEEGDQDVLSILSSLTEKNLIKLVEGRGDVRYQMLETIREYAGERLEESGELDALEARFAVYFLRFAEQAEPELYGADQMLRFDRIEDEYANIRSALVWFHDRHRLEEGLRLAGALGWFWFRRARFTEGEYWLELFRTSVGASGPQGPRAKAAYYLGWLNLCAGRAFWGNPEGRRFFEESLGLWREVGNRRGVALSQVWLGWKAGIEGKDGWQSADESVAIARQTGDPWTIAWCLKIAYSHLRRLDQDLECRQGALEEAIALARKTEDPFLLSQALNGMGNVHAWVGELEAAEPWYLDSLRIARKIDDSWSILDNINCLADGYLGLGHPGRAKELFAEGLGLAADLGARAYLAWFIGGLSGVARRQDRGKRALRLAVLSESILAPESGYDPRIAEGLGLDDETAASEWSIAQRMTVEQAVDYALADE